MSNADCILELEKACTAPPNCQAIACPIIVTHLLGNYWDFWLYFDLIGCITVGNNTCVQLQGIR